jgi:hypothetical protein
MDNPRDFMCRLRNGYKTVIDADWKKNITLIQIRCFNRKSLKTHLITDISLCIAFTKQLLGSVVGEGDEFSPVVEGDVVPPLDEDVD